MAELKTSLNLIISFILNNELFGIEVDSVQEIIKSHEVTPVPGSPSFLEGIINLRGMIVPVLSLRKRFSLELDENIKEKIVVVNIKGLKTGIIVDSVKEVKNIEGKEFCVLYPRPKGRGLTTLEDKIPRKNLYWQNRRSFKYRWHGHAVARGYGGDAQFFC